MLPVHLEGLAGEDEGAVFARNVGICVILTNTSG